MQARRLPARHGFLWLLAGFRLFRANPPLLAALTMSYLFLVVAVNLLPLIGPFLVPIALPSLILVLANGCRAIEQGRHPTLALLIDGVEARRGELLRLGGLHLLGSMAILLLSMLVEDDTASAPSANEDQMLWFLLRLFLMALPIISAFWFSPLLTGWDNVPAMKAVFFSFVASWRNWQAFATYFLTTVVLAIALPGLLLILANTLSQTLAQILAIPLKILLIFVMAPSLMASVYISYRDVFHPPDNTD